MEQNLKAESLPSHFANARDGPPVTSEPVSIVIPTLNRADYLSTCLASLEKLNYRRDSYEVVVVDGGSTDSTAEVVRQNKGRFSSLELVVERKRGSSAARNTGIALVKNRYIALTDDDAVVDKDWLQRLMNQADECTILVGKVVSDKDGKVQYGCRRATFLGGSIRLPLWLQRYADRGCTCNMLVPQAVWRGVGGFREDLVEAFDDSTFCLQAQKMKHRVRYVDDAVVFHRQELNRPERVLPLITYRTYSMLRIYEDSPLRQRLFVLANAAYVGLHSLSYLATLNTKRASELLRAMQRGHELYGTGQRS